VALGLSSKTRTDKVQGVRLVAGQQGEGDNNGEGVSGVGAARAWGSVSGPRGNMTDCNPPRFF